MRKKTRKSKKSAKLFQAGMPLLIILATILVCLTGLFVKNSEVITKQEITVQQQYAYPTHTVSRQLNEPIVTISENILNTKLVSTGYCPQGFNMYENDFFQTCVPKSMYIDKETSDNTFIKITFRDKNESLEISSLAITSITDECSEKTGTPVQLSGYQATRYTQNGQYDEWGSITCNEKAWGYTTALENVSKTSPGLKGVFLLSYKGNPPSLDTYQNIERSIRIKKM